MKPLSGTVNSWQVEFGSSFAGQRVMVTGASGFIGRHLSDALLALGADVYALSRKGVGCSVGCASYSVDLRNLDVVRDVVTRIRPQVVYHLASQVTGRQEVDLVLPMLFNNLVGTVHLLLALTESGCEQVITMSSSEEPTDGVPISPYAAAKMGARMYAGLFHQTYDLPIAVAKLFMAYGPRQQSDKLIPYLTLSFLNGQSPKLRSGTRICDFIYIDDAIRGLLKLGLRRDLIGKTVDLGTGNGVSIVDLAMLIATSMGSSARPQFSANADRVGERSNVADLATTQALLNWTPNFSLTDGLKKNSEWYQAALKRGIL